MEYLYLIKISDSPAWPVKTDQQAYGRLVKLGQEGRLGECVVEARKVEPADWRTALGGKKVRKPS